jgi:hypothetical protein
MSDDRVKEELARAALTGEESRQCRRGYLEMVLGSM